MVEFALGFTGGFLSGGAVGITVMGLVVAGARTPRAERPDREPPLDLRDAANVIDLSSIAHRASAPAPRARR